MTKTQEKPKRGKSERIEGLQPGSSALVQSKSKRQRKPRIDLAGGPEPNAVRDDEALTADLVERFQDVLRRYVCRPTHEGWRRLAVHLLLAYEPLFQIQDGHLSNTKQNGEPLYMRRELTWMAHLISETNVTHAAAAREVAAKTESNPGKRRKRSSTLKKLYATLTSDERKALTPRTSQPLTAELRLAALWRALDRAGSELEAEHAARSSEFHDEGWLEYDS